MDWEWGRGKRSWPDTISELPGTDLIPVIAGRDLKDLTARHSATHNQHM